MTDHMGRFLLRKRLGGGGFGEVFLAEDPAIGRQVAIKVFRPKEENLIAFATPTAAEGLASLRARFLHEAKILAKLDDEPHVIKVLEFGELPDGTPYYVMPYLPHSLADELGKDVFEVHGRAELPAAEHPRALPLELALDVVEHTLKGLAAAHTLGLVHRDIKPANLMRSAKGVLQIVDFGIAKAPDGQHSTVSHVGLGSRNYMAPEQRESAKHVDARADLYAVGVVAYRALTGKLPVGRYADPEVLTPTLGKPLNDLILRLLAQDKLDRPGDAIEALRLFQLARASSERSASTKRSEHSSTWAGDQGPAELRDELKPLRAKIVALISEQGFVDQQSRADLLILARMGDLDEAGLEGLIESTVKADKTLTAKSKLGEMIKEQVNSQEGGPGDHGLLTLQDFAASIGWDRPQLINVRQQALAEWSLFARPALRIDDAVDCGSSQTAPSSRISAEASDGKIGTAKLLLAVMIYCGTACSIVFIFSFGVLPLIAKDPLMRLLLGNMLGAGFGLLNAWHFHRPQRNIVTLICFSSHLAIYWGLALNYGVGTAAPYFLAVLFGCIGGWWIASAIASGKEFGNKPWH